MLLSISPLTISADMPRNLADAWIMVPNEGQADKFEAAFKKHIKFRLEKKDPRQWETYTPIVGDDLSYYVVRHCCSSWADIDSYRDWAVKAKVSEHWNKHVAPYVKRIEHYFDELDFANSHWPNSNSDFKYYAVTTYHVKMGTSGNIAQGKKALSDAAKAMKWPYSWSWAESIGGTNQLMLVIPYKSYADMAPPKVSFYQSVVNHLNDKAKADEMFKQWSSNFKSTNYSIYTMRTDLSMEKKE